MDFSPVQLDAQQQSVRDEIVAVLDDLVDDELLDRMHRNGDVSDNEFVRKLAKHRLSLPRWPVERGGRALDETLVRVLENELDRRRAPRDINSNIWGAAEQHGSPELHDEVRPKLLRGEARLCLGYTESESGSDIAGAKLRAVKDGDDWILNGSKIFTTGAEAADYVFLLTRTDPDAPKHRGLTMFLAPLKTPGVEIQAIRTFGGERTNAVYFTDVRIADRYRLGAVNDGWTVLRGPLDKEHDFGQKSHSLKEPFGMWVIRRSPLEHAFEDALKWAKETVLEDGSRPIDDPVVRTRLGRIATDIEFALCTDGPLGRVAAADVMTAASAKLIDLIGPRALLPKGAPGAIERGDIEYAHRFAQGNATYMGTVEVFRQMIAQHVLGLPRPHMGRAK